MFRNEILLAARAADAWRLVRIQSRYRIRRVLQIRPQVGRGSAGEAADVRIFDDRLVELDQRRIDQRQNPAIVLPDEGGVLQIQKKPQRNTYRGFFPMSTWPGAGLTQATRNTSTQEDAYKVGKKPVVPNHSLDVRYWHKADMLNALTNVRFWAKRTVTNRC